MFLLSLGAIGIAVVVPLYITMLKKQEEALLLSCAGAKQRKTKLTLESLGGNPLPISYFLPTY